MCLDSGVDPGKLGRYSFLVSDPFLVVRSRHGVSVVEQGGLRWEVAGDPFSLLRGLLNLYKLEPDPQSPPFLAGAVGYLSYDLRHFVERVPAAAADDLALPDCYWAFFDRSVVFDHQTDRTYLAATEPRTSAEPFFASGRSKP